jgi:DDE domain
MDERPIPSALIVRTNRYVNNLVEQDHRRVKQRIRPMLGFKNVAAAEVTLTGIEPVQMIRKGQFEIGGSEQTRSLLGGWSWRREAVRQPSGLPRLSVRLCTRTARRASSHASSPQHISNPVKTGGSYTKDPASGAVSRFAGAAQTGRTSASRLTA